MGFRAGSSKLTVLKFWVHSAETGLSQGLKVLSKPENVARKLFWKNEPNKILKNKSNLKYISLIFLREAKYSPRKAYAEVKGIFSQDTNLFRKTNLWIFTGYRPVTKQFWHFLSFSNVSLHHKWNGLDHILWANWK